MASAGTDSGLVNRAGRTAALPLLVLLGIVLPLAFLPQLEDFLYYFRPRELLPAYGTAWLYLAVLALPTGLLLTLALRALARFARVRALGNVLAFALLALAGAAATAALIYCLMMWLRSLGWAHGPALERWQLWAALTAGVWIAATRRGRALLEHSRRLAIAGTLLGALAALSLPFFGWRVSSSSLPASPALEAAAQSAAFEADAAMPSAQAEPTLDRLAASAPPRSPPHILLLTIDALSAEHMSLYGAQRATTPSLSAFAQSATTFDRAYANSNFTTPGVASIITGTRPWSHRALQLQSWPLAATRRDSLPAVLQQAGYQTAYISTNSAAGAAKNGFGSYFQFASRDRIRDLSLCTDALSAWLRYTCPIASMPLFSQLEALAEHVHGGRDTLHYDPRLAIEPALGWLQSVDKSKPVFLWVHLFPPHSPYAAPAPWLGLFDASNGARKVRDTEPHWGYTLSSVADDRVQLLSARYDESVAYADYYAGELLRQALELLGDNTVVVITADHGESFRHGYGAHTGPGLFDEIIHVPLIVRLPGQRLAARSSALAEQVDIAPTLIELAGLAPRPGWEGRSLLAPAASLRLTAASDPPQAAPALARKAAFSMNFEQNPRFSSLHDGVVAVIQGRWKLVHYYGRLNYPQMPPAEDTLYDLALDPTETVNQAAQQPAILEQLRTLIEAQMAQHGGAVH